MLFLRTCKKDGTSHGGYKWNLEIGAINEAPDYNDKPECGGGLHGIVNGIGSAQYLDFSNDAIGVVFSADADIVEFDGKAKVRAARVEFVGELSDCAAYIHEQTKLHGIIKQLLTGGDGSTLTGGDRSTLTGGDGSTLTGGDGSTLTGGNGSTLTGGDGSTLTGGDRSTLTGGDGSTLTGGDWSTLTGGKWSTLTGGDESTLTGGYGSTLTGGYRSTLIFRRWNGTRYKFYIAYPGEDGIKPNVKYKLDDNHNFVEVAE